MFEKQLVKSVPIHKPKTTHILKTGETVMQTDIIPFEKIRQAILFIRGQRVMLDRDLAMLYGVETRAL